MFKQPMQQTGESRYLRSQRSRMVHTLFGSNCIMNIALLNVMTLVVKFTRIGGK